MEQRSRIIAVLLSLLFLANGNGLAQTQFDEVQYSKPAGDGEKKGENIKGFLRFDDSDKELTFIGKGASFTAKYGGIKGLLYERTARPRYVSGILLAWPLLFTKGKQHWFTIQYTDPAGNGKFAILRLDKKNYQQILATAEAQTGLKVERTGKQ